MFKYEVVHDRQVIRQSGFDFEDYDEAYEAGIDEIMSVLSDWDLEDALDGETEDDFLVNVIEE